MTDDCSIKVTDLHKTYQEGLVFKKRLQALQGVSLSVGQGEVFGLLGPNGAGKTTFIKILLGIVRKTSGTAKLLGRPAGSRVGRRQVGYLSENMRFPPYHTALSALSLFGRLSGMSGTAIRAKRMELLEMVGLAHRIKDPVRKYSKGMLQRLGLAQALIHDPQVVFLDEPTDGLDPVGRADVRNIIQDLKKQGRTVFLNSHLLQEVEMVCDRVAILQKGRLRLVGDVDEIASKVGSDDILLQLEMTGDGVAAETALAGHEIVESQVVGENRFAMVVRLQSQQDVDLCVDRLRAAGISIVSLAPRRFTLEEAFMQVVKETEE